MAHDRSPKPPRLKVPQQTDFDVGYSKPPVSSRFKPGKSGNPRGRPKGARNKLPALNEERLKSIVLQEAYRTIKVRDGEKNVTVPMATAIVRSVAVNAAKGNNRAAALITQMIKVVEDENKAHYNDYLKTMIEYKCNWEQELERCKRLGIVVPDPVPHPDHILIDFNTSEVRIIGPFTKEDIPRWEMLRKRKQDCDVSIGQIQEDLKSPKMRKFRKFLLDDLAHALNMREMLCKAIPD